jgi:lycopene cyclase domain-containing protein
MPIYSQVLLFSLIIPLIFSFHRKIEFYKKWPAFIKANLLTIIPFIIWDELFTIYGVWGFNSQHVLGIYLSNLPIEEVLFFIIIPYCCVFTYEVFNKLSLKNTRSIQLLSLILGITILLIGIISYTHIYSAVTFISLGIVLVVLFLLNPKFMKTFYVTYIVITVSFFIIVNGILTGGTLANPPVWYNNNETLNIRIWTIPVEDFFYSMLLLVSNIWLFEIFQSRTKIKNN